jgi:structure-specific endonuclease subunit SLX1
MDEKKWYNYIIFDKKFKSKKTYIGSTINPTRRFRQHNQEIKGGAKYTRGGKWIPYIVLYDLFHTKSSVLSYEWNLKNSSKKFKQSKSNVKLFQEDIPSKGKSSESGLKTNPGNPKRFYVLDPSIIWNKIVSNRRSCFYEFWNETMKIQFALDLDMKGVKSYEESLQIVKSNINKVRKAIKEYYGYSYSVNKIILLESTTKPTVICFT